MRSGNPALNDKAFEGFDFAFDQDRSTLMTLNGTVIKTMSLLGLVVLSAAFSWYLFFQGNPAVMPVMIGGAIAGFVVALVTMFKAAWSPITAPLYAIFEGLFLGGVSAMYQQMFDGIVVQAVFLTFGTMFALLTAYQSGLIKATENFKLGVVAATGGIMIVYLVSMVLNFFFSFQVPFIHSNGWFGIAFSGFVVVIAALNLVLDFDFIENGVKRGAPKYMEWYAGFGLLVTLVWLYLEILRLLSKLQSRD